MTDHTQVLIIGAGPTGLALAVALRTHGVDCRVVERDLQPPRQSRGKGLQPRTLEVLRDLGVIGDVLGHGEHRQRVRLFKDQHQLADLAVGLAEPRPDVAHPNIVMMPQWRTSQILDRRLKELGGRIDRGLALTELSSTASSVTATLVDDLGATSEVTADFLVGCDGGRSTARRQLGIGFTGRSRSPQRYLLGDVTIDGLAPVLDDHRLASYAWLGSDGSFLGLAGLPGERGFQIGAGVEPDDPPEPTTETLQRLLTERSGRRDLTITGATWLSDFSVKVAMAEAYRTGRCFLAGDACHVHPPTGGQGMNTGIQDAYNLAWKLSYVLSGRAGEPLLDSYAAERMPVARALLRRSTDILDSVITNNPLKSFLIDRIVLPLLSRPAINRAVLGRVSQIDLGYPDSPLSAGRAGRAPVRPGDRAPDGNVLDDDSRPARLHDLLDHTRHTLVHWSEDWPRPDLPDWIVRRRVHDPDGRTRRRYGVRGDEGVIVRPDGYLAWRGTPDDLQPDELLPAPTTAESAPVGG